MAITEFRSSLKIQATIETSAHPTLPLAASTLRARYENVAPLRLRNVTLLSVREHILTGYTQTANLEVSSVIQPVPKVVDA